MDPRKREEIQRGIDQGQAFLRLQGHGDWAYYHEWVQKLANDYERAIHAPDNRGDHAVLASALEGYAAVTDLLNNFDRAIGNITKLQKELDAADGA